MAGPSSNCGYYMHQEKESTELKINKEQQESPVVYLESKPTYACCLAEVQLFVVFGFDKLPAYLLLCSKTPLVPTARIVCYECSSP